jgi:toxin ParE1/3/4
VKKLRLVLSDAAVSDILEQADWYASQSGHTLASRWEKAVTTAILRITKNPHAGTPCTFRLEALRGVRRTAIRNFPKHLLFYRFHAEELFILRVVHGARDLESLF